MMSLGWKEPNLCFNLSLSLFYKTYLKPFKSNPGDSKNGVSSVVRIFYCQHAPLPYL